MDTKPCSQAQGGAPPCGGAERFAASDCSAILCRCNDSTGWTTVKCCNICGLPVEAWQMPVLEGWTVRAEDYDRLRTAALWLARACRDRLPPGHFAKVDEEYTEVRRLLSLNDEAHGLPETARRTKGERRE